MAWSKLKQHLESFLCPALYGRVEYRATGYRYVGKKRLLNMAEKMKLKHPIVQYFYELRLSTLSQPKGSGG